MHAFDILGDPVRRRILELLSQGEHASGEVVEVVGREFGITQSAVSQHLKVLRESGFATVRVEGARRLYAVEPQAISEVESWLERLRSFWSPKLEALATEVARGKKARAAARSVSRLPLIRGGGKRAIAQALAELEALPDDPAVQGLLDEAWGAQDGLSLGLTGPPGVGKSTLANALVKAFRARGQTVAVAAVDPSSRASGGAILGDRARIDADPADQFAV